MLESARDAADARDLERVLAALLAAWRVCRAPRLAASIDRVSALVARPPIDGGSVSAFVESWMEIEARRDPVDVPRLVAPPWPKTLAMRARLVEALCAWPDDPRIAIALADLLVSLRAYTWTSGVVTRPILQRLRTLGDVRAGQRLAGIHKARPPCLDREALAAIVGAEPGVLGASELTMLDAIDAAIRDVSDARIHPDEAALFAAVYASPADDAPRIVLADALTERGDPRGELIQLQLAGQQTPATRRRERDLLARHEVAIAGPLHEDLAPEGRRYERGFVVAGMLAKRLRDRDFVRMFAHPAWATVTALTEHPQVRLSNMQANMPLHVAELAGLRALHELRVHQVTKLLPKLAGGAYAALDELSFAWFDGDGEDATRALRDMLARDRRLRRLAILPRWTYAERRLPELRLGADDLAPWWSALPAALERLTVVARPAELGALIAARGWGGQLVVATAIEPLATCRGWVFTVPPGPRPRIHASWCGHRTVKPADELELATAALGRAAVDALVLVPTSSLPEKPLRRIAAAAARASDVRIDVASPSG